MHLINNCICSDLFTSNRTISLHPGRDFGGDDFQAVSSFEIWAKNTSRQSEVTFQLSILREGWFRDYEVLRDLPPGFDGKIGNFQPGIYRLFLSCNLPPHTNCGAVATLVGDIRPYTYVFPEHGGG